MIVEQNTFIQFFKIDLDERSELFSDEPEGQTVTRSVILNKQRLLSILRIFFNCTESLHGELAAFRAQTLQMKPFKCTESRWS